MTANEPALLQLSDLLRRREVVVYLGPDLPQALTGVPSWSDLAQRLSERGRWLSMSSWPQVAARYEQSWGRRNLADWLDEQVSGRKTGAIHQALAALPVPKYIAASYDDLLQKALLDNGRPPNVVVSVDDLSFVEPDRPTVVKLLGEASAGRRDALMLTDNDLLDLLQRKSGVLAQEVFPAFTSLSWLIIGQDLRADFFRQLYAQRSVQSPSGRFRRPAFAIWSPVDEWETEQWGTRQLTILETDPLALLHELVGGSQTEVP